MLRVLHTSMLLLSLALLSSCGAIISNQTEKLSDNLSSTILNFEDPETVKTAPPTFLILIDSIANQDSASGKTQMVAAQMYGSFAGAFVTEPKRQRLLSNKAWGFAQSGSCKIDTLFCDLPQLDNKRFNSIVSDIPDKHLDTAYAYAVAWLAYIQTNSNDWTALAQLASAQVLLERVGEYDETIDNAGPHLYLGAIAASLPPSLGGKPEQAKYHFDRAIMLTEGKSLLIKVEYARRYARGIFDKSLHHQLLSDVLQSPIKYDGLTLMNAWAQAEAERLLATEDDYFD